MLQKRVYVMLLVAGLNSYSHSQTLQTFAECYQGGGAPPGTASYYKISLFYTEETSNCILVFTSKVEKKNPQKLPGQWPNWCEEEEEINGTLNSLEVGRKTRAAAVFSQEMQHIQMKARIWGKSLSLSLRSGGDATWTRIQMRLCLGMLR